MKGRSGTTVVLPKGCFLDKNGQVVTDDIKIELAEALTLEEMIMTGLSTFTSEGEPLETDGMIYFSPTKDGEPLTVNPEIPVYFEVPTKEKKSGMMAYKGVPDSTGAIAWTAPKEMENYLVNVDLDLLDFLPPDFEKVVLKEMKKRGETIDDSFIDSLYYSLSVMNSSEILKDLPPTDLNEPYYNNKNRVIDGGYEDGAFEVDYRRSDDANFENDTTAVDSTEDVTERTPCGVDPALIKVMKSKPYQNTFVATYEFEKRMGLLHESCDDNLVKLYLNNLDRNLWEIDKLAADKADNKKLQKKFNRLSKRKETNVINGGIYGKLLKNYYNSELKKVKPELEKEKQKLLNELEKAKEPAKKVIEAYKEVLLEREFYRMPKYGFTWSDTGWVNVDKRMISGSSSSSGSSGSSTMVFLKIPTLEAKVTNGDQYDRVYCYTIQKSIKSLYRLNPETLKYFYAGNKTNRTIVMGQNMDMVLIAIGYKDDKPAIATQEFNTGVFTTEERKILLKVKLKDTTNDAVSAAIAKYETEGTANSIVEDLKYMKELAKEKERQAALQEESDFLRELERLAYPCCNYYDLDDPALNEF